MTARQKNVTEQAIDPDIEVALLSGLTPLQPCAASRANMLNNILAQVREHTEKALITVRIEEGEWVEIAPGVCHKRLIGSGRVNASLYRMAPGSSIPGHEHPSDEECVCLQGEVNLGGIVINEGDFHLAPRGSAHGTISSPQGCLLYIRCGGTALPA